MNKTNKTDKTMKHFSSFEEAFEDEKKENHALDPLERLAILHELNKRIYGKDVYTRGLQRVLEVVEKT